MLTEPLTRVVVPARALDLRLTLAPLRFGKGDPTCLLRYDECFRATRTPAGPATVHLVVRNDGVHSEAWGPGAEWALDQLPTLLGELDEIDDFRPEHALVADLHERTPGLRIGASHRVFEAFVPAVCGQQVSAYEARRAHRQLIMHVGEQAPGPAVLPLLLPPDPRQLAGAVFADLHTLGLEQERADIIRRAAARVQTLEGLVDLTTADAETRLRSTTGVGTWAGAMVRQVALGDADAVPVGDPNLAHVVAWAFLGERRGSDAQMLELLEPFRGHRGRVLRLVRAARLGPPRHDDGGARRAS